MAWKVACILKAPWTCLWSTGRIGVILIALIASQTLIAHRSISLTTIKSWNTFSSFLHANLPSLSGKQRFTACVVYLAIGTNFSQQETTERAQMEAALRQFDERISAPLKRKYPALVIHDGWITAKVRETLSLAANNSVVLFEYVNLSDTAAMRARPNRFQIQDCPIHNRSYRDMNRVFIRLMFELPALQKFDYWMRLDLDIRTGWAIKVDPFATLHYGGYDFGYIRCLQDWGCNNGLKRFLTEYATTVRVSDSTFFNDLLEQGLYFYGNVGVGRLSLFASPEYLRFARAMDDDGGIVRHRWDDQHTYAAAIAMFSKLDRTVVFGFDMLPMYHRGAQLNSKSCYQRYRQYKGIQYIS